MRFYLSAIVLLLMWGWYWQQPVPQTAPDREPEVIPVQSENLAVAAVANIAFMDVALPPPPGMKQTNRFAEYQGEPEIAEKSTEPESRMQVADTSSSGFTAEKQVRTQHRPEDLYRQLVSDDSLDIQLALPAVKKQRESLLRYLYQCQGAEFGVFDGKQVVRLSPKNHQQRSHWLRIVNGGLGSQERLWLSGIDEQGTPVRLFPVTIDRNIAQHLAQALSNDKLEQLHGDYQLYNGQLYLRNIVLNGTEITAHWPISITSCAI